MRKLRQQFSILALVGACTFTITIIYLRSPTKDVNRNNYYISSVGGREDIPLNFSYQTKPKLSHSIPKIIHHKWKTGFVPREYLNYILSWRTNHPDYEHWWWDDHTARSFMKEKYPAFFKLYNNLNFDIQRASAIRYFLLYEFGGIYKDLDIESLRNIQPYLDQFAPCVASEEPEVNSYLHYRINYTLASNAFFACRPKHPFFDFAIKSLEASFTKYKSNIGHSTGPFFIQRMVKEYQEAHPNTDPLDRIIVTPGKYIQPTFALDGHVDKNVQKTCREVDEVLVAGKENHQDDPLLFSNQLRVCEHLKASNFTNKPGPEAYCDHHWSHSFLFPSKYTGNEGEANVNIHEQMPVIDPSKHFSDNS